MATVVAIGASRLDHERESAAAATTCDVEQDVQRGAVDEHERG